MQIKVLIAALALAYNVADVAADDDGPSEECMEDAIWPAMLAGETTEDNCSLTTAGCAQAVTDAAASTVCTQEEKDMMEFFMANDCAMMEGMFCDHSSYGSSYGSSHGDDHSSHGDDGVSDECIENTINPFLCDEENDINTEEGCGDLVTAVVDSDDCTDDDHFMIGMFGAMGCDAGEDTPQCDPTMDSAASASFGAVALIAALMLL